MRGFNWLVLVVGALGLGLLLVSHWVHALGFLPYAVLLACPLMHLFHRRHGGHEPHRHAVGRKEITP